ncbi:MAG: hypothetical protein US30_C0009G0043 [Candidatus Moranbacteria bacterium GW2011_GWF2_36_839]|nr:MAG: hypothetical protein US27_C0009G0043 [Candidatus Moranbacteria bacterium GW2011_GWF1_36_78]KKQ16950.1 MAG: hypothetical protein US30_C0009G0043 [Candidatus Moranbacteria bacterium GW2011_GWF2_36_839]HAT73616.1 hypothetical protein [Candidatus Moranbacteria bacterium]HBY10461.1 hypothetical protein [Candidatus Moranbacteria bacterium]
MTHKICEFYKKAYLLSSKVKKQDRFGIFLKTENLLLEIFELSVFASFEIKHQKLSPLNSCRIKTEVLKRLFRIMLDLKIIEDKKYIELEFDLIEISKMTNGWIKYLKENPRY